MVSDLKWIHFFRRTITVNQHAIPRIHTESVNGCSPVTILANHRSESTARVLVSQQSTPTLDSDSDIDMEIDVEPVLADEQQCASDVNAPKYSKSFGPDAVHWYKNNSETAKHSETDAHHDNGLLRAIGESREQIRSTESGGPVDRQNAARAEADEQREQRRFQCELCDKTYLRMDTLRRHQNEKHWFTKTKPPTKQRQTKKLARRLTIASNATKPETTVAPIVKCPLRSHSVVNCATQSARSQSWLRFKRQMRLHTLEAQSRNENRAGRRPSIDENRLSVQVRTERQVC